MNYKFLITVTVESIEAAYCKVSLMKPSVVSVVAEIVSTLSHGISLVLGSDQSERLNMAEQ